MTRSQHSELFQFLPAIVKKADAAQGSPLGALLEIMGEQAGHIEDNIQQLYDDAFVETAQPQMVPYIAELLGIRPSTSGGPGHGVDAPRDALRHSLVSPRRQAANAVHYYRRKGTISVLEELSRSIAGWPARAVEFAEIVAATWHANRSDPARTTADVDDARVIDAVDSAFDKTPHLIDFRSPHPHRVRGRHHIRNVGLFVWRNHARSMTHVNARCYRQCTEDEKTAWVYAFDPLGDIVQLFVRPRSETLSTDLASESNVPGPLRLELLRDHNAASQASQGFYGEGKSISVWIKGFPNTHTDGFVPRTQIEPADLSCFRRDSSCSSDESDALQRRRKDVIRRLRRDVVLVDPGNGLLAVANKQNRIRTTYHYGATADLGGGEYRRPIRYQAMADAVRMRTYCRTHASETCPLRLDAKDNQGKGYFQAWSLIEPTPILGGKSNPKCRDFYFNAVDADENRLDGEAPARATLAIELSHPVTRTETFTTEADKNGQWSIDLDGPVITGQSTAKATIVKPDGKTEVVQWRFDVSRCLSPIHLQTILELTDSNAHQLADNRIVLDRGQSLEIRAAKACRPTIVTEQQNCDPGLTITLASGSRLTLSGVRIAGGRFRLEQWQGIGDRFQSPRCDDTPVADAAPIVSIYHTSVVPKPGCSCGPGALELDVPNSLVSIQSSVLGPIKHRRKLPGHPLRKFGATRLALRGSIVSGGMDDAAICGLRNIDVQIDRCTLLGIVKVRTIDMAQDSIFDGRVTVERPQVGGVRFCAVPVESITPPRYYCQPDLAIARQSATLHDCGQIAASSQEASPPSESDKPCADDLSRPPSDPQAIKPRFVSKHPSHPSYARLSLDCPIEIRQGAEDESEMGVYHDLYEPQREANLRERLKQFTPVSMHAEIYFAELLED